MSGELCSPVPLIYISTGIKGKWYYYVITELRERGTTTRQGKDYRDLGKDYRDLGSLEVALLFG